MHKMYYSGNSVHQLSIIFPTNAGRVCVTLLLSMLLCSGTLYSMTLLLSHGIYAWLWLCSQYNWCFYNNRHTVQMLVLCLSYDPALVT